MFFFKNKPSINDESLKGAKKCQKIIGSIISIRPSSPPPDGECAPALRRAGQTTALSPGTIHVRVEKMKQAGIIEGTRVQVNPKLGYDVCCFIRINLKGAPRITRRPWPNCRRWTRWWRAYTPRATTASS